MYDILALEARVNDIEVLLSPIDESMLSLGRRSGSFGRLNQKPLG